MPRDYSDEYERGDLPGENYWVCPACEEIIPEDHLYFSSTAEPRHKSCKTRLVFCTPSLRLLREYKERL